MNSTDTFGITRSPFLSVEFFPPKSEQAAEQLIATAESLKQFSPDFASITYGAGGSTRDRTLKYANRLSKEIGYAVMPHLTCVGHTRSELVEIIQEFHDAGINRIMALRGDPPEGETDFKPHTDGLSYAGELVELIRECHPECIIGIAGYPEKHPEAPSLENDLQNLKRKVDFGADFITTQLFFDNKVYFDFVEKCQAIEIETPVLPGLMSATSREQAKRFCEMCGTTFPEELDQQMAATDGDASAAEAVGVAWTLKQAEELLKFGVPGLHLYILNKSGPATVLIEGLKERGYYAT